MERDENLANGVLNKGVFVTAQLFFKPVVVDDINGMRNNILFMNDNGMKPKHC